MSAHEGLPAGGDPDPIDDDDRVVLRTEILRLRELLLAADGRIEVAEDRIAELEQREIDLDAANAALHEELGRSPLRRLARAVRRRLRERP